MTINALLDMMQGASGIVADIEHVAVRPGDVWHSMAAIGKANAESDFAPSAELEDGVRECMSWLRRDLQI